MLNIQSVNHIGIRISDKASSIAFYEKLGFVLKTDAGFEDGHPVIMKHDSGVVLNLLGPATIWTTTRPTRSAAPAEQRDRFRSQQPSNGR